MGRHIRGGVDVEVSRVVGRVADGTTSTSTSSQVSSCSLSSIGFDGTLVGGVDVVVGAGAGEVVLGAGVGEQPVDRLELAVLVDGCAEGERLADGGLTVGEGGLIHAVRGKYL